MWILLLQFKAYTEALFVFCFFFLFSYSHFCFVQYNDAAKIECELLLIRVLPSLCMWWYVLVVFAGDANYINRCILAHTLLLWAHTRHQIECIWNKNGTTIVVRCNHLLCIFCAGWLSWLAQNKDRVRVHSFPHQIMKYLSSSVSVQIFFSLSLFSSSTSSFEILVQVQPSDDAIINTYRCTRTACSRFLHILVVPVFIFFCVRYI